MRLSLSTFRPRLPMWKLPSLPSWRKPRMPFFRICSKKPLSEWLLRAVFIIYIAICVAAYFQYEVPWIKGESSIRIGPDSNTYWSAVTAARDGGGDSLVSLSQNLLGPVLLGLLLPNGFAVMCFNIGLFILAMKIAGSISGVNKTIFASLILSNAVLLPALATLNKEILALFAAVLAAKYVLSGRRLLMFFALTLAVSFLTRWEQAAIFILYLLIEHSPLRFRPKLALGLLVGGLSIGYPLMFSLLQLDPHMFDWILHDANTILRLNSIQDAGGFFIVVVPKIFMAVSGRLATPWIYWSGDFLKDDFQDPQQDIFQPLGCLAFLLVLAYALLKRRLDLNKPLPMLIALTLVITAITPFIQPRYTYPAYVLLCLEIARSNNRSLTPPKPT